MIKLPVLFDEIIKHDKKRPDTRAPVVNLRDFRIWRTARQKLTWAAEKFIIRQRSGT